MKREFMNAENVDTFSNRQFGHILWEHIHYLPDILHVRSVKKNRGAEGRWNDEAPIVCSDGVPVKMQAVHAGFVKTVFGTLEDFVKRK